MSTPEVAALPFAQLLRRAREAAGLTQSEASNVLKGAGHSVSRRSIIDYEAGGATPTETKQQAILHVLSAHGGAAAPARRFLEPRLDTPSPIDGLSEAGSQIVTIWSDEAGPVAAMKVVFLARPEPRHFGSTTRVLPLDDDED